MNQTVPTIDEIAGDLYAHFREGENDGESYDTFLTHLWRDFTAIIILIQQNYYTMPIHWYYGEGWNELSYADKLAIYDVRKE
jgi:hypothetical protein